MRPGKLKRRWAKLRRASTIGFVLLTSLAGGVRVAAARDVIFPIRLDEQFLTLELLRSAYTDPGRTARVFDDGSGCNSLVLFDPKVTSEAGRLRVRTSGEARFGVSAGGRCLLPLSWSGQVEVVEEPRLDRHAPIVRFHVVDSTILDRDGEEPMVTGTLWGWVKDHVHPRLETRIDLEEPVRELREVLPTFGVGAPGSALHGALATLALDEVKVEPGMVEVMVRVEVPELPSATETPSGSEPPLTPEELQRWQTALQQWDAFLTFVVKVTGSDTKLADLRSALLSILLEERYAMTEALASPERGQPDPVRPLFLRTWSRLAPVLRRVGDTLPADQALRYLSFVSAGDALQAIDEIGPESGVEISADGLRRLARLVAPASAEDPLHYGLEVDPELRALFGFGAPLPPPEENLEVVEEALPEDAVPTPQPEEAPADGPDASSAPDAAESEDEASPETPGDDGMQTPDVSPSDGGTSDESLLDEPTADDARAPSPDEPPAAGAPDTGSAPLDESPDATPADDVAPTSDAAATPDAERTPDVPRTPDIAPTPDAAPTPEPAPTPDFAPTPDAGATLAPDEAPSPDAPEPTDASGAPVIWSGARGSSWLAHPAALLGWLSPGTAWAADAEPSKELLKRLNAWAPTRADIAEYAPLAHELLESVTTWLLSRHDIDPAHVAVFRALVPATAWKESCWRQYVKRNGKLATLTSNVGSVGIMQVNVAVWRGFYEVNGLKRDIGYNARAGGEILSRYWTDYAVARGEHKKGGGVDALARAAYAAYNGGPGELSRYRQKGRSKRERTVDADFFAKYQKMKSGDALAVASCFTS